MSCDFMCLLNPTGATCTCPEGKVLVNGTCSDVNISGRTAFTSLCDVTVCLNGLGKTNPLTWQLQSVKTVVLFFFEDTAPCDLECCGLFCGEGELCRPPCENGGRCLANEKGDWRCYCWPDFSGERCEVNHCTDYCLNGGTCVGSPLGKYQISPVKHYTEVVVNRWSVGQNWTLVSGHVGYSLVD